jgi:hypothetical protein
MDKIDERNGVRARVCVCASLERARDVAVVTRGRAREIRIKSYYRKIRATTAAATTSAATTATATTAAATTATTTT